MARWSVVAVWTLVAAIASMAHGQATTLPAEMPAAMREEFTLAPLPPAPDSVEQELIDAKERPAGLLRYGPVSIIDPLWKKMNQALDPVGLKIGLAYTVLYQGASAGPGTRDAAGGDIDLFGDWRLIGQKGGEYNGYLYFAAENRHGFFTEIAPAAIGGQIGSLWGTTNGFGEQDLCVKELYWQQHFATDRLIIRVGKLDPENYYNSNYWQSDSKYFANAAFSTFPVRAFPGQGLGMNLTTKLSEQWYISTGFQDAQGRKTEVGFNTFFGDFNLFGALEVGYTPTFEGLGRGNYRFTGWYRDAGQTDGKPHDAGFTLSFDQQISKHLRPFFRAGSGEGNINNIDHMISGGIGWEGKLITESDVIGIGAAWGKPANSDLNDQYAAEVFYRLQVSPDNQFTVGYQLIVDPSNAPDSDLIGVVEVRWRVAL